MYVRNLKEIVRVKVTDKRTIVISHNEQEDKIIIGQQIHTVDEEGKPMNFFLKGALNFPADMLPKVEEAISKALDELAI